MGQENGLVLRRVEVSSPNKLGLAGADSFQSNMLSQGTSFSASAEPIGFQETIVQWEGIILSTLLSAGM